MKLARPAPVRAGEWLSQYRNLVFPAATVVLLAVFPAVPVESSETLDVALHLLGFALVAVGAVLRALATGLVPRSVPEGRDGDACRRRPSFHADPFRRGLRAHCRNPLMLGNLVIVTGLLINHANPWTGFLLGGFFLFAGGAIVLAEEHRLLKRYGRTYLAYCLAVPRWSFRLDGWRETLAGNRLDWRRILFEEYAFTALWTVVMLSDLAEDIILEDGFDSGSTSLAVIASAAGVAGLTALAVACLKRCSRFQNPA
jgi:protein-S-isoprenylcysteine O-methyltransferase Ste14